VLEGCKAFDAVATSLVSLFLALCAARACAALGPRGRDGFSPDEEITGLRRARHLLGRRAHACLRACSTNGACSTATPLGRRPDLRPGLPPIACPPARWVSRGAPDGRALPTPGSSALLAGLATCGATWPHRRSPWARFYGLFVASFLATTLAFLATARRAARALVPRRVAGHRLLHEMGVGAPTTGGSAPSTQHSLWHASGGHLASVYTGARILAGEELAGLAQRKGTRSGWRSGKAVKYGSPDPAGPFPSTKAGRVDQVPAAQGMKPLARAQNGLVDVTHISGKGQGPCQSIDAS